MSTERLAMRKLRELIRLKFDAQLTNRQAGAALNVSASTVSCYSRAVKDAGLTFDISKSLNDTELLARLEPYCKHLKNNQKFRSIPDWQVIHKELRFKQVTLKLLYEEYLQQYPQPHLGYSRFCQLYKEWRKTNHCSMTMNHKPGDKCFIDYCGVTIPIYSKKANEVKQAQIFVATLGCSNYTYAEATWTQSLPDWINSNVNALNFFNGVPTLLVPDNLKSAITDSNKYDPVVNPTYSEFAQHYGVAILPARPYSPQDKGKVENAVQIVERWILARLRKQRFYSLSALNREIQKLLKALNNKPFQRKSGTRESLYLEHEQTALKPLPKIRYQMAQFKKSKVAKHYHVLFNGSYYSVPYTLIGQIVECRITANTVEIFHNNHRVASHVRSREKGVYLTNKAHMPKNHLAHQEWNEQLLIEWVGKIGPSTINLAKEFLNQCKHPEHGYRYHLGLQSLAKRYGNVRLETACQRALAIGSTSHQSLSSILKNGLDKEDYVTEVSKKPMPSHDNIRGKEYYQPMEK